MSRIEDVALAAGVSTATVSRALRGLPKVNPTTRARVLAAAARLEYVASPTASSLASGKTRVVAVVVPYVTRWYFANLIAGAARVLNQHGYHVLLLDVGENRAQRGLLIDQQMLAKRVDAVLAVQLQLQDVELDLLARLEIPVVTVGPRARHWPGVLIDDVAVAATATEHLLGLGHRDIAYVGGVSPPQFDFVTPGARRRGFEQAMAAHQVVPPPERLLDSDWTTAGRAAVGRQLLRCRHPPTAVFAGSDEMAIGVLLAARRIGVNVPGDLSVIGVDDHQLAASFDLTTVRQHVPEQGARAARLLLSALTASDVGTGEPVHDTAVEVVFDAELVVRGSTAAVGSAVDRPVRRSGIDRGRGPS